MPPIRSSAACQNQILVLPPAGVMEKTIDVYQSQTASGLTSERGENLDLTITSSASR
jgi:hypothetical protein